MKIAPSPHYLKLWITSRILSGVPPQMVAAELRRRLAPADTERDGLARERYEQAAALIDDLERNEE